MLLVKMVSGLKHGSAVLVVCLSLRSSVTASFGCDNGVMSLQASGGASGDCRQFSSAPVLTCRFGSVIGLPAVGSVWQWAVPLRGLPSIGLWKFMVTLCWMRCSTPRRLGMPAVGSAQ